MHFYKASKGWNINFFVVVLSHIMQKALHTSYISQDATMHGKCPYLLMSISSVSLPPMLPGATQDNPDHHKGYFFWRGRVFSEHYNTLFNWVHCHRGSVRLLMPSELRHKISEYCNFAIVWWFMKVRGPAELVECPNSCNTPVHLLYSPLTSNREGGMPDYFCNFMKD